MLCAALYHRLSYDHYITLSHINQGASLVYHPQLVAVYHQTEDLDIIKPQEDARDRYLPGRNAMFVNEVYVLFDNVIPNARRF